MIRTLINIFKAKRCEQSCTTESKIDEQTIACSSCQKSQDLADCKCTDDKSLALETLSQRLIKYLPQRIFVKDRNLVYVFCNENYASDLGIKPEQIIGKNDFSFYSAEQAEAYRAADQAVMDSNQTKDFDEQYSIAGVTRWVHTSKMPYYDEQGQLAGVLGIFEDITERKHAEEELRKSKIQLLAILESTADAILAVNDKGNVLQTNRQFKELWRIPQSLMESGDDSALLNYVVSQLSDPEAFIKRVMEIYDSDADPMDTFTLKDGRIIERYSIAIKMNGERIGRVWSFRDITNRKHVEDELQRLDKLQSIGTLAGGIAHDFNNILQGLYGNISFVKEVLPQDHPCYGSLEKVEQSMHRAVRLTKQLLTFAKGGAPIKEMFDLGPVIEETARFDLSGSNVKLVYNQAADLWRINADKGQIQQVVSNLVINAREAMPNGGNLHITLENANLAADTVTVINPGKYVKVSVKDDGAGIAPEVIKQIFNPYFTTKKFGKGLGLPTAWSIMAKHDGYIGVVSELGKGAAFTFHLPASTSLLPAETKPSDTKVQPSPQPAKILVMDDEETICDLVSKILISSGYSVATALGGKRAIALYKQAQEAGAPFDLVLLDLTIPGEPGGKEVIKELQVLDPKVRAIVFSGYADNPVMANPTAYGFKDAIAKPYTSKALRETVARLLQ
ncbi:MAG: PAS domain-containing protein [bacterium]